MTLEEFLKLVKYTPMHIGKDFGDGMRFVTFRSKDGFSTNLEFGTVDNNGQYLYWEIVDWNNYHAGDTIALDSERRHDVLNTRLTKDNADYIAAFINASLDRFYAT